MDYNDGSWSVADWIGMAGMMLVFWALVIGLIVWVVRSARGSKPPVEPRSGAHRSPDEVLAERYARGEIDENEFRRRRALLNESTSHST